MFFTSGYVLIACVLVKSCFLHTFRRDFSQKKSTLGLGWHVLRDFRQDVLRQHVFQNATFLYTASPSCFISHKYLF